MQCTVSVADWLVHRRKPTAALFEDNGAAEPVEPLSIETRSVNGHCVLLGGRRGTARFV